MRFTRCFGLLQLSECVSLRVVLKCLFSNQNSDFKGDANDSLCGSLAKVLRKEYPDGRKANCLFSKQNCEKLYRGYLLVLVGYRFLAHE